MTAVDASSSQKKAVAQNGRPRFAYWLLIASWTALVAVLAGWGIYKAYQVEVRNATTVALDNFNKDLVYRRWAAKQGGVYVPISAETPPNPHLSGIPEREITTPSGRQLTLVNPSYMTRQVHELGKIQYGVKAHITSLKPVRPENAADAWEAQALKQFERGGKDAISLEILDGAQFLRFMRPLPTEEACLKCHASQGYKLGDVRGGISISLPWAPYREHWLRHVIFDSLIFVGIWLVGIVGIGAWHRRLRRFLHERQGTEGALRESEERFRFLSDASLEGVAISDQGRLVDVSDQLARMLGYEKTEMIGREIASFVAPWSLDVVAEHVSSGVEDPYENELLRKNGSVICVESRARTMFHLGKSLRVTVIRDITERKRAQAALQESEARYRRITEGLTDYQYTVRVEDGRAVATKQSPACALVTGYTAEEFDAEPYLWIRMVASEDRDKVTRRVRQILAGEDIPPIEHRIQRKDGETRWVRDTTILLRDAGGRLISYDGVIKDITESVIADEAVAASEEKYRTLFEESRDVIYISTPAGSFIDINRAGVTLLGYPSQEALKAVAIRDIYLHPEDRTRLLGLLEKSDFVEDFKTVFVRLDRQQVHVSVTATAVRDTSAKITSIRGIIRDITENQKLEAQFRQSQKMESIGTLAGGVAHDFNNILTAISGYGHLTLMRMAPDDPHRLNIQHILDASERAAHLTGDLMLFSRKQPINRKPVDLNEGIRKLSKFLVRVIGEDICFMAELSTGEIPVLADEHQISQVLMNLAANARDAMQGGGVFTIATETVQLDEQFVTSHNFGKPGRHALITVSDTGTGMDEQTRQRIFEPFFTTKDPGKGTGLGMAVVYGIVKQHDGLVTVYSEPGHGSTFRVYLPITAVEAAEEHEPVAQQIVGGTETILLAEDDRAVREMTQLVLRDYGYTVIVAVDGEDAVQKFKENQDRIQLLLFDLIMPRKTGKDAYDEIRRLQPGIKVVFSSGYDPDMVRQQSLMEMKLPLIRKPVEIVALLRLIRSVLDE